MQLEPGLHLVQNYLEADEQRRFWEMCRDLASGAVPMYSPTVRGGKKMSVGMLCLGRHWNATTYSYEATRSDFDGLAVPPLPPEFQRLAVEAAARAGFAASSRPVHHELLRSGQPDGRAPGQGRVSRITRGRSAHCFGVARRHRAIRRRRAHAPRADTTAHAAVGRYRRDGGCVAPALSRRDENPARDTRPPDSGPAGST